VWWQEPEGGYDRLPVTDLVEAAERIVCAHEELIVARAGGGGTEPSGDGRHVASHPPGEYIED
jgi:hypothetical protein